MADAGQVKRTPLPLILALATGAWTLGVMVAGQAGYPGYDQAGQFISELGAVGAPTHPWAGLAGFIPIGILQCLFCLTAALAAPRSAVAALGFVLLAGYGAGAIAGGIFPCDAGSNCMPAEPSLSQLLHNALGGGGYLAGIAGLAVLGAAALRWPGGRWLGLAGFAACAVALAALLAI
ncbi:MAG: DUF998 domain-containing protein, partial [Caulobacterales bacterium]|uniref:DUF998 domain-containing protein n=1 Tax=Glycocaulis sp. TaxID=1969725 RepID=UPI003FA074B5